MLAAGVSPPTSESKVAQAQDMRLRDIVALSTLPAIWQGANPLRIAESLAAAVFTMLDAEFVYVLFAENGSRPAVSVAQTDRHETSPVLAAHIGTDFHDWARTHDPEELLNLPETGASGMLKVATRALGLNGEAGVIAAAFSDDKAPEHFPHLLLNIAATQAVTAVHNADLLHSLRASEQAVLQSELRYRVLVSVLTNVPWATDAVGNFIAPQVPWETYTGQVWPQYSGRGWVEAIHPDDRSRIEAAWLEASSSKAPYAAEGRIWNAARQGWRYFSARAVPMLDKQGNLREWVGAYTDIHEEKRHEEQLKGLADTALAIAAAGTVEETLQIIARAAADIVGAHQSVTSMTVGEDRKQTINHVVLSEKYAAWRNYSVPPDGSGIYEQVCQLNRPIRLTQDQLEAHPDWRGFGTEARSYPPLRGWLAVPLHDREGRNVGLIQLSDRFEADFNEADEAIAVQLADMAAGAIETLHLTDSLKLSNEQLRSANKDLEQFAYSASHDLQEPLRSVKIYSELLASRYGNRLEGEALEFLEYLRTGAGRMEMLVRDLLSYTQATQGDQVTDPVPAGEALNGALANLSGAIKESGARVISDGMPSLRVHPTHLQQVFQNLISNAIKYRRHDIIPAVQVSARRENEYWLFSVSDNGIGIEAEYKEHIFGLFKRLHGGDEYSGTGIGLALCQRIVERYHGRIWVESEPGQGSIFYFTLPA